MDQFDAAWKLLAGNHPEAFLRVFAPDLAIQVDWHRQYCLPDECAGTFGLGSDPRPDDANAVEMAKGGKHGHL
jgi:hypothetical protein